MKTINKKKVFEIICEAKKVLDPRRDEISKIIAHQFYLQCG